MDVSVDDISAGDGRAISLPLVLAGAARGSRSSFTSLCAHGTWCTLKADVRSLSFAAVSNTTTAAQTGKSPARTVASPHLIAIVGGAVGAAVALAAVLALVHVLRVRRKVERFRRSMNVLGPGASLLATF
jgi:uncharacterized integral membrane protein